MTVQLDIFLSTQNRDAGILRAVKHADEVCPNWSRTALNFLLSYKEKTFLVEDVRKAAEGIIPEPSHSRAWGAVVLRAAKSGYIKRVGFANTKNVRSHSTPASVWRFVNR